MGAGLFCAALLPAFSDSPWRATLDEAKTAARTSQRDIFIYFYAPQSKPSIDMRQNVLTDSMVAQLYQAFEMAQVDITENDELVRQLAPNAFRAPIVVLLRSSGESKAVLDNLKTDAWRKKIEELIQKAGGAFKSLEEIYSKADEQISAGKLSEGEKLYLRALALDSDKSRAYNGLGIIEAKRKNYRKAVEYFKQAIEIDPNYIKAKENLAAAEQLALIESETKPGLRLTPAPAIKPTSGPAKHKTAKEISDMLNKALALQKSGKKAQATDAFKNVLTYDDRNVQALNSLGQIEESEGHYPEAIYFWTRALKFDSKNKVAQDGIKSAKEKLDRQ
ncbi:MAG: tetratricopeptide repeat protein [Candidatus Sumerlaeota bacterium]|nr:tetratricopeptide repeat protein [Candidatus Sumerlaeota bacterium]